MDNLVIPEISDPKNETLCFKLSKKDKELITEFVEKRKYRMSAALRVMVLSYIKKELENE